MDAIDDTSRVGEAHRPRLEADIDTVVAGAVDKSTHQVVDVQDTIVGAVERTIEGCASQQGHSPTGFFDREHNRVRTEMMGPLCGFQELAPILPAREQQRTHTAKIKRTAPGLGWRANERCPFDCQGRCHR